MGSAPEGGGRTWPVGADPGTGPAEFVEVPEGPSLEEGQMVGVDIQGRRVLLARVAGQFYAIGGICTHEHAKLDEGALFENVVFCPLHYSSFDVRSGAVLGPPADRAEPTHAVMVEDGKVYVSVDPVSASVPGADEDSSETTREESARRPRSWQVRIIEKIDSLMWLQRLSDRITAVTSRVRARLEPTRVLDLIHGRWLGHALHPALSDLPIGLWGGSLLLYLVNYRGAAVVLSLAGIVASLGTAVTGFVDWTVTDGHERRVGLLHGLLNTGALAIQVGSPIAYFAGANTVAIACSAASFAVTVGAAYLGGHLVLGRATMVNHTAWITGPPHWTALVETTHLSEEGTLAAEVGGRKVLLHRDAEGTISAIEDACSHAGAPLSLGRISGDTVSCPWHGSRFCLRNGAVLRGPAAHPQPILETRVSDGWIEVRMASIDTTV